MQNVNLLVSEPLSFTSYDQVLEYSAQTLLARGIVKESYLAALREREQQFPTGIELDGYAVGIPHCDVEHVVEPCIFIIRTKTPVKVQQADGDDLLDVNLIINLVVTNPSEQLRLLKALFTNLQDKNFYQSLLNSLSEQARSEFLSIINP